jgi:3-phosphoshikimate 1-carboxyvinyltransferase
MRVTIHGGTPLKGSVCVPADKSITHRGLMFAAIAEGESLIHAKNPGEDNFSTAGVFQQLGVPVSVTDQGWRVQGVGLGGLTPSAESLDCGNSGTTIRLLAGLLCGGGVPATLLGDESLSIRPMGRVCKPLRALGGGIRGVELAGKETPPLTTSAGSFGGGEWRQSIASAQVKSCLLLAGLMAGRDVSVWEPSLSRDHTERMLTAMGVSMESRAVDGGMMASIAGGGPAPRALGTLVVPGDISSAAFWASAALLVPDSAISITGVGLNPSRTGCLEALERFGYAVECTGEVAAGGEDIGTLEVAYQGEGTGERDVTLGGSLIPRLIDELVVLGALACGRAGTTLVQDAHELRVKESDRVAETARVLRAFGAEVHEREDGYQVRGPTTLRAAELDVGSDHRVALTAAVLAAAAPGASVLSHFDVANVSYPSFIDDFRQLGGRIEIDS